jgi:peptidoglycan/LPS O-acetylase OafA/YrhL
LATLSTTFLEVPATATPARVDGRRFYHPELDILRFFAFLLVFIHHAIPHDPAFWSRYGVPTGIARIVAGIGALGAFGVDVFFVLSAYLITELLLREKALLGDLDLKSFYTRRILRIWPLYFFFLAIAGALTVIMPGQQIGWRAASAFLLLGGNWWIVFHGFPSSIIFPLWSVSIEEQFYLMWPPLVRKMRAVHMASFAAMLLVIASCVRVYLGSHGATETQVWCNTLARLDPLAAGILLAVFLRGEAPRIELQWRIAIISIGVMCLAMAANYWQIKADPLTTTRILIGYPVIALGGAALLLGVLSSGAMLRKSALVYLGRISYGLYVYHVAGLMVSDYLVPNSEASMARYFLRIGTALALTITFSAASFRWIETPFLNLKQRFAHVLSRPGG